MENVLDLQCYVYWKKVTILLLPFGNVLHSYDGEYACRLWSGQGCSALVLSK